MTDLVSVIVPVYNAERTLQKCVKSILEQSYKNIEVILVDDGSTDCSLLLCKQFEETDSRVFVIKKVNGGVSSARNCGIESSKGNYIIFLDSDDWLEKNMIERYVRLMCEQTVDIVIGGLHGISEKNHDLFIKKTPVIGRYDVSLWDVICNSTEMFGYIGGKMFKKDIIDTYKIRFNERMYAQEDLDFCLSYYESVKKFYLTDYVGYQYYYEQGKRIPPYCDFMRNQLKLLSIAEKKCELTKNAYDKIQQRIGGYIYVMLYERNNKEETINACKQIREVNKLEGYLKKCMFQGEKRYIISWYLNEKYIFIYYYFKLRKLIKRLVRK